MRRIFILALLLLAGAKISRAQSAGCGATPGGLNQYDQSQCGNVAPFPAAPATPTVISACGSYAAGTYQLSANIGSTASATCLTFTTGPIILDFNGHTVTGQVFANNVTMSGTHIYSSAAGGTLTCAINSDNNVNWPGCLWLTDSENTITAPIELDHLTIINTSSTTDTASGRNVHMDAQSNTTGNTVVGFTHLIHNITSTAMNGTLSTRIYNFNVGIPVAHVEYSYNNVTCLSQANACQGMACGTYDCKIHNNKTTMQKLTLASGGETGRASGCDTQGGVPMSGCEIYNNYYDVGDARAIRFRNVLSGVLQTFIHDNLIDNISVGTSGNYAGALHICDPDSGTDDGSKYLIWWNTLNISDGNGLFTRGCTGNPVFQNNRINKIGVGTGTLATIRAPIAGSSTTFTMKNNVPVTLTSSPNTSVESGASLSQCNTGTTGGAETITTLSCPGPTAPWASILKPVTDISCAQSITTATPCAVDWTLNGVPGGIPSGGAGWTQSGTTITPLGGGSDDGPQINTAISSCAGTSPTAGHFVQLAAGTFQINTEINLNKNYCVLRGMGANQTILNSGITTAIVIRI